MLLHYRQRPGFTLIEIMVVVIISVVLVGIALANYRRGNQDSVLQREASLLMSRLRYAQELTAAGSILRYQIVNTGSSCLTNSQCNPVNGIAQGSCTCCPGPAGCENSKETPQGGYAVGFSCLNTVTDPNESSYNTPTYNSDAPQIYYARSKYYLVADRIKCTGSNSSSGSVGPCFPPSYNAWDWNGNNSDTDGIISMNGEEYRGDTLKEKYAVDSSVQIKDLQITYMTPIGGGKQAYTCADTSPWGGIVVPGTTSTVPTPYPIQATVRFLPPDGRTVDINDNIYHKDLTDGDPPAGAAVDLAKSLRSVEIMLKLKDRATGCKVIKIERSGTISESNNENCKFIATGGGGGAS